MTTERYPDLQYIMTSTATGESYHCHEYHEVIFFLSGEGRYVVEGKTYRLQPGDLLVISDREIHRDSEKSGKRRDRYIAYIDSAFLEEAKKADRNGGGFITVL